MKIGLAYDLKTPPDGSSDTVGEESEEYDPPETIDALASEIEGMGHQPVHLGGGAEFLANVQARRVDFVFNISEGRGAYRSREAQVPCVLEMLGIPYSGSDPLTLSVCLDKPITKQLVGLAGLLTPPFRVVDRPAQLDAPDLKSFRYPVFLKPAFEGSSKGVHAASRADSHEELQQAAVDMLRRYRQPVLVEEFIAGKEVTVGIVGNNPPRIVAVMEVAPRAGPDANFTYTLDVKRDWKRLVTYRCPPDLPADCIAAIEQTAVQAYSALQIRDVARMDLRIDAQYRPYFLEANPLPGLGDYSDLPIMAQLSGWTYSQLVRSILEAGLERVGLVRR